MAAKTAATQIGYGGAAGGGKSDLILGLSLTEHQRSLISRVEGTQLQAIIDRSKEIIGSGDARTRQASFNSISKIWSKLPNKRIIQMAGMPHPGDEKKFQGQPHDHKAFDEATEFQERQVRFIAGWLRSPNPAQRTRLLLTFNPPTTAEGQWVIKFFAPWLDKKNPKPAAPGEIRFFTTIDGEEKEISNGKPFKLNGSVIKPVSRTFIPAKLSDNAYYSSGDYESVLQAMPEPLRSQMLYGDFTAGLKDDPWQVISTKSIDMAQERWLKLNAVHERPRQPLTTVGVDVARGGSDWTVISRRYGNYFAPLIKISGANSPDGPAVARAVLDALQDTSYGPVNLDTVHINVDVIGVGSSAFDSLRQLGLKNVWPINASHGTTSRDRAGVLQFYNKRAEMLWGLREALNVVTGDELALPDDSELKADLSASKWELRTSKVLIESKEDIKKRIGRSPDSGDALVLAHYAGSNDQLGQLDQDLQDAINDFSGY